MTPMLPTESPLTQRNVNTSTCYITSLLITTYLQKNRATTRRETSGNESFFEMHVHVIGLLVM